VDGIVIEAFLIRMDYLQVLLVVAISTGYRDSCSPSSILVVAAYRLPSDREFEKVGAQL
jgi:hypothetical protein